MPSSEETRAEREAYSQKHRLQELLEASRTTRAAHALALLMTNQMLQQNAKATRLLLYNCRQ